MIKTDNKCNLQTMVNRKYKAVFRAQCFKFQASSIWRIKTSNVKSKQHYFTYFFRLLNL